MKHFPFASILYVFILLLVVTVAKIPALAYDASAKTESSLSTLQADDAISYKIAFDGNGATSGSVKKMSCTTGKSYKLPANSFKKKGYAFAGWNTKADGSGTIYEDGASVKNLSKKSGVTVRLYAQWTPEKYTITYKLNKGVMNSKNPSVYTVESKTVDLIEPVRAGYDFLGWYSDSKYTKQVLEIPGKNTGNLTLYAEWQIISYNINYELDGGTNNKNNPSTYTIKSGDITLSSPTKEGYTFDGWYINKRCSRPFNGIEAGSEGDVTVYAKWIGDTYTVRLDANGGLCTDQLTYEVEYLEAFRLPACSFRKGYVCTGWNTKRDGSGKTYKQLSVVSKLVGYSKKEITLYAQWKEYTNNSKALSIPKLSGTRKDKFLTVAASQLGFEENTSYVSPYGTWMGHPTWPWCVYFVSWCAEKAGVPASIVPRYGSTKVLRDFYIKQGRYYYVEGAIDGANTAYMAGITGIKTISPSEIEAGDILLQETNGNVTQGADHTTIVIKYDERQNVVYVVAGNTGLPQGAVKYYRVPLSQIHGICKPRWQ